MKKDFKILIGVICGIIILYGIAFGIDYYRCSHLQEPIFVIKKQEDDASYKWVRINIGFNGNWPIGCDSSSYVYTGGYGGTNYLIVYVETNVSN